MKKPYCSLTEGMTSFEHESGNCYHISYTYSYSSEPQTYDHPGYEEVFLDRITVEIESNDGTRDLTQEEIDPALWAILEKEAEDHAYWGAEDAIRSARQDALESARDYC